MRKTQSKISQTTIGFLIATEICLPEKFWVRSAQSTVVIVIDLEKAFDNVDTDILLGTLETVGVDDNYIDWN